MENFDRMRQHIIQQFRLEALSPEEQDEVFSWLRGKVLDRINRTLSDMLGEADAEAHSRIAQAEGADAARDFLEARIPNLPYVIDSIATRVLKDMGVSFEE